MCSDWKKYKHPDIMPGAEGYKADIPGKLGIIPTKDLPLDKEVELIDPKGTGQVSGAVDYGDEVPEVDYTVLIVGDHEGSDVVFTFHPGDPIRPSEIPAKEWAGKKVKPKKAIELGIDYVKVKE